MKILIAHNYYQYQGGEDIIVYNEKISLKVKIIKLFFLKENSQIKYFSIFTKASLLWKTSWSNKTYKEI